MTKYILHGGKSNTRSYDNRFFFQEIIKGLDYPIKLLLVYYAREEKEWQWLYQQDKLKFSSFTDQERLDFLLAAKEVSAFIQQIKEADAIYISGGKTLGLKKYFKEISNLSEMLNEKKVIAGSSAGVHVLCKYYYNAEGQAISQGLGILPIKVFCHYKPDKAEALRQLEQFGEPLEVITLEEGKFVVLNY